MAEKLPCAVGSATRESEVNEELLTPDKPLAILWETHEQLHTRYTPNGKTYEYLVHLRNKTAQARRYAKHLVKSRRTQHCESFGERTDSHRMWRRYRAVVGKTNEPNTTKNISLATGLTTDEFQKNAAIAFFPQPLTPPNPILGRPEL